MFFIKDLKPTDAKQTVWFHPCKIICIDHFIKAYCCLLLYVFSLFIFTIVLSLMLHIFLLFSDHGIFFLTIFNCEKHIDANYLYMFSSHLKMISWRSKSRGFLSLVFIIKSISKKLLIKIALKGGCNKSTTKPTQNTSRDCGMYF